MMLNNYCKYTEISYLEEVRGACLHLASTKISSDPVTNSLICGCQQPSPAISVHLVKKWLQ